MNVAVAGRLALNHSVKTPCILAVEDDEDNLLLITYLVKQLNCFLRTAKDGLTALSSIREDPPDLILLDIVLPKLNGIELITRLKQESSTFNIPIIVITGLTSPKEREQILSTGCDACFVKPYLLDELEKSIDKYLQLSFNTTGKNCLHSIHK